ncbi:MAG: hypothetical protein K5905_29335 [Roseibium sp.]|uniref:hypothetical protein n=1 Tax=Roseibium sp. TaxID=1936156 RepID=UPI0026109E90|nr:hypothetical protein [Roseibium sp.]MCV0429564.1 hypothetical protein [Roseibium sp.]
MTQEIFAEALSVVNVRNGVVRMVLVDQSADGMTKMGDSEDAAEPEIAVEPKAVITMPIGGFLYTASIIQKLLADEKFGKTVRAMVEAGLVNAQIDDQSEDSNEAT